MGRPMPPSSSGVVFPASLATAFRHLEATRIQINGVWMVDKMNAAGVVQRRVAVLTASHLYCCSLDGEAKRDVALDQVADVVLLTVSSAARVSRIGVGLRVPHAYDILLMPLGGEHVGLGTFTDPQFGREVIDAAKTASGRNVSVERLGRFATGSPDLTPAQVLAVLTLRKPLDWRPFSGLQIVTAFPSVGQALPAAHQPSRSGSQVTVVDVIERSPQEAAKACHEKDRGAASELSRVIDWDSEESGNELESPGPADDLGAERNATGTSQERQELQRLRDDNSQLRVRVESLEAEVTFWRDRFLTRQPLIADALSSGASMDGDGWDVELAAECADAAAPDVGSPFRRYRV